MGFRVSFIEERLPSGHSAIKPRSMVCCSDGCPSGGFSHLHTRPLELSQSDHRVLGHLSYEGPFPLIAQSGQVALGRVLVVTKLLPFKNYGGHCAPGTLQCSIICFAAFPRSVPPHNPISELGLIWCVPFQIMSNHLNSAQVDKV